MYTFNLLQDFQAAYVEMAVRRLAFRTAIEIEGWKRIPVIRELFNLAKIQVYLFQ